MQGIKQGRNVILDACHISERARCHPLQSVNANYRKICVVFDLDLRTVRERCLKEKRVSLKEVERMWKAFQDTKPSTEELKLQGFDEVYFIRPVPTICAFGWAKPVPVNFSVLTRKQIFGVAVAGPLTNIFLALILAGIFHLFSIEAATPLGNYVLLAILFNLILAVVNLLPVPPLDGSKMAYALLKSPEAINAYKNYAQYGMFILVAFLLLGGFRAMVLPVAGLFYTLLGLPLPVLTIKRHGKKEDGIKQNCFWR